MIGEVVEKQLACHAVLRLKLPRAVIFTLLSRQCWRCLLMEGGRIFDFPESRITYLLSDFKSLDSTKKLVRFVSTWMEGQESGLLT